MNKKNLLYFIIVIVAVFSFWNLAGNRIFDQSNGKKAGTDYKTAIISINDLKIKAVIADTDQKRDLGLSGQPSLGQNQGELFIFDQPGLYDFWMKDMNFPLDIIWLDENKKIVDITANFATSTYPNKVTSRTPAKYVLEINAGVSQEGAIKIGDVASF